MKIIIVIILCLLPISIFAQSFDSYIVKFKPDTDIKVLNSSIQSGDLLPVFDVKKIEFKSNNSINRIDNDLISSLSGYYITTDNELVQNLYASKQVESITPNYIFHIESDDEPINDQYYSQQWALRQINAEQAWKLATGKDIIIGMVDTGIDYFNPDLKEQLWINNSEDINGNGKFDPWSIDVEFDGITGDLNNIDDDNNGAVDDIIGYDYVDQSTANLGDSRNPDWNPNDEGDHGTSVAAVMVARKNDIGIIGLAYNAKIMTVRAFDATGEGESDDIAKSIVYAALNGADIINMSFGEPIDSPILRDAIKFAYAMGCFMSASSGNSNSDDLHYPSGYSEVCAVGGSAEDGNRYGDANWGSMLDLIAPGRRVITTDAEGKYEDKNGTSISAPYVSAAAALIIELYPNTTVDEIRSTLMANANDLGPTGWDEKHGAGILDISKALNDNGRSNISIIYPINESLFFSNRVSEIPIIGSLTTPLFDSCHVLIGEGLTPSDFLIASETITSQILNDTIATVTIKQLQDTVHTLVLRVFLKNKSTIEKRIYLNIRSSINALILSEPVVIDALDDDGRSIIIATQTNFPSKFKVNYRIKGSSEPYHEIYEVDNFDVYHFVKLNQNIVSGVEYEAKAIAYYTKDDYKTRYFNFTLKEDKFPIDAFIPKSYELPLSYLNNYVLDINNDGLDEIAINNLSNLTIGRTEIYSFSDNQFTLVDSNDVGWIPLGYGDSNGDQNIELFATRNGDVNLSQSSDGTSSIFEETLFSDEIGNVFWGTEFEDLNYDGLKDIIAYSDSAYFAYSFQNGQYRFLDVTPLPENLKRKAPDRASEVSDFDNDGNMELCFTNIYGNLLMYEFINGEFKLDFVDSVNNSFSNQYMCKVDIEGDGIYEVLTANYGTYALYGHETYQNQIWNFRLYKSFAKDSLRLIWKDHALGVKAGIVQRLKLSYKNGITAGELDGEQGDEIVLAIFPDLYVLTWDSDEETMKPVWRHGSAYSNSAIIHDFDKNGKNEIGFNTYSGTQFFEMRDDSKKPLIPTGISARVLDENTVEINWNPVENADQYEIYALVRENGETLAERYFISTENSAVIDTLTPLTSYEFVIRTFDDETTDKYSEFSDIFEMFTHDPYEPIKFEVENALALNIHFNGDIDGSDIQVSDINIFDLKDQIYVSSDIFLKNNSTIIVVLENKLSTGSYRIEISSFSDRYSLNTLVGKFDFEILDESKKELYLKNLSLVPGTSIIKLQYSHTVDSSAVKIENYEIKPFGSMLIANYDPFDKSIISFFPDDILRSNARGVNFTITARNIMSESGIPITTGAGNTLGFVLSKKTLNSMYIYPSPVELSKHDGITFANLTNNATLQIFKLNGEFIAQFDENDGNGGVYWDLRNNNGNKINPGIYFYKASGINTQGISVESDMFKFLVKP